MTYPCRNDSSHWWPTEGSTPRITGLEQNEMKRVKKAEARPHAAARGTTEPVVHRNIIRKVAVLS